VKIDPAPIREKWLVLKDALDERQRRLWAAAEAKSLGHGGVTAVSAATGIARSTIGIGLVELRGEKPSDLVKTRRRGGGGKRRETKDPKLLETLKELVEPTSRGDPQQPLLWTAKSTHALAREISRKHGKISPQKVGRLLIEMGYSLQAPSKKLEGAAHPDRNAQFEFISVRARDFAERRCPVLSVDTKKKELIGAFKTGGREWQPKGKPIEVMTHDFKDLAKGKAIPYGVFDVVDNSAYVNVGIDHDTPSFAVRSIELWWERMGASRYKNAKEMFITADAGGSNSYRSRVWKCELQKLADKLGMTIHVSHFPPGTSKWNKIEHRLFSYITMNWRGRPLTTYETVINIISSTTTKTGLRVSAMLDEGAYPLGEQASKEEMNSLAIEYDDFHGDWNYAVHPRRNAPTLLPRKVRLRSKATWRSTQKKARESGLSLAAFCEREGLSYDAIRKQRSRLKRAETA
jgi:hypothetical protein